MLSDAEQRRLAEIESSLQAEDPKFVHRFAARPDGGRRQLIVARVGLGASLMTVFVALAFGIVLVAIIGVAAAGASIGLWITRRHG